MSQQAEVRFRIPLGIVIPLGALLLIGVVTIGMSRILLSVPKEAAVVIAIAVAANVLIACAFIAARPNAARSSWAELLIVFLYPLIVGVVLAQMDIGAAEHAGAEEAAAGSEEGAAAGGGGTAISAVNVAFDTDSLSLPAGEEVQLEFTNEDASSIQHNVSILESEGGNFLFEGEIIPGGQSTTYTIDPLKKGEYYFQCDVHPGMNGEATVQ